MSGAGMAGSRPGILLDRDGTIIVDHGYVGSIDRVTFIEGAPEAIASFNRASVWVPDRFRTSTFMSFSGH